MKNSRTSTKLIVPFTVARLRPAQAVAKLKRIQKAAVKKVRSEPVTGFDRNLEEARLRAARLRGIGKAKVK